MDDDKTIEINMPFERIPRCACDPGCGDPPSKQKMLECRLRGGPCSKNYNDNNEAAHERQSIENDGYQAYCRGLDVFESPYQPGSDADSIWVRGWSLAESHDTAQIENHTR